MRKKLYFLWFVSFSVAPIFSSSHFWWLDLNDRKWRVPPSSVLPTSPSLAQSLLCVSVCSAKVDYESQNRFKWSSLEEQEKEKVNWPTWQNTEFSKWTTTTSSIAVIEVIKKAQGATDVRLTNSWRTSLLGWGCLEMSASVSFEAKFKLNSGNQIGRHRVDRKWRAEKEEWQGVFSRSFYVHSLISSVCSRTYTHQQQ